MSSTIWKSRPSSAANARHGSCSRARQLRGRERAADGGLEERDGLQRVQRVERGTASRVEPLAADHRERRVHQLAGDRGRVVRQRQPKRLGRQSIACEHGHGLPELRPDGRCARRSASWSSAGRSSWTSENECTSSTAAAPAAGSRRARRSRRRWRGKAPAAPACRRARGASARRACPALATVRARRGRPRSAHGAGQPAWLRRRRRGGFRLGRTLRPLQLGLDLACQVGELLQDLDRLVGILGLVERARAVQPREQCSASRSATPQHRSCSLLPLDSSKNAVDQSCSVVGCVALGERDRLVIATSAGTSSSRARARRRAARCARPCPAGRRSTRRPPR